MSGTRTPRVRIAAGLIVAGTAALAAVTTWSAAAWIGRPFPGFFLLRNRVVASVSLPGWPVDMAPDVFQATVVAVDDLPVRTAEEVYARVRARPAGTRFAYTFDHGGATTLEWIESRLFTWRDGGLIFGAYLFDGLVFAAIGVGVWTLSPRRATPWALLGLCLSLSTYVLTAMDLYGPHRFFRLHALAESFLPAALLHLALLFPIRRATALRAAAVSYLPATILAVVYELRLDSPALYTGVHAFATLCLVAGAVALLGAVVWGYLRAPSELVRHRVRVVVLGLLVGFAIPVALFTVSLLENGRVPVNMTAFTAFAFPLSIAYDPGQDNGMLRVTDNAMGMSYSDLERALYIAMPPLNRTGRSRYGMGMKTAAFWIGKKWSITTKKLGEIGDPNTKMVDVSVEEDPSAAVYERLQEALTKLGFSVVPYSDAMERKLQVEIRSLELKSVKTPFTFETELRAVLGARAANGLEYYDRQFNVRTRKDGAAPPFEKDSTMLVNTAVSQALEDMLADEQLLALLAK